jgi:glycosyltransferase involved in cell wall biosynthesis
MVKRPLHRIHKLVFRKQRKVFTDLPEYMTLLNTDPGIELANEYLTKWLCRAQDYSLTNDLGVARDYSLINGWASSYPETTGYIISTFITLSNNTGNRKLSDRAIQMLDWLVSIQLENGGFQGGKVDERPVLPVTFNTGQILIGLAAGYKQFGDCYIEPLKKAAVFLRDSLDEDGCWRKYPTPFAIPGDKAYETHVSWSLLEAALVFPGEKFEETALRQIKWALKKQADNGWVSDCCLNDPEKPLTHTLGYFLKGLVEAHRYFNDPEILNAAIKTGKGLLSAQNNNGSLPGRLNSDWTAAVDWSCLTGNVQIADSWFYLGKITGDESFSIAARKATSFVRRTILFDDNQNVAGGISGSFPRDGEYGTYQFLSWGAKFAIDANLTELELNSASVGEIRNLPVISIIIPVYNVEHYLPKCLDSIFIQDLKNVEVICVNDGTQDKSRQILSEYKNNYPELLIIDRVNGGLSAARNTGLKAAKGRYVFFLDSDDYLLPDSIKTLLNCSTYNLELVHFNAVTDKNATYYENDAEIKDTLTGQEFFKRSYTELGYFPVFPVWMYLYSRHFLSSNCLIFKEGYIHEDIDFTLKALYYAKSIKQNNIPVIFHRVLREGAITTNFNIVNLNNIKGIVNDLVTFFKVREFEDPYFSKQLFFLYMTICSNLYKKFSGLRKTYLSHNDLQLIRSCCHTGLQKLTFILLRYSPYRFEKYILNENHSIFFRTIKRVVALFDK